MEDPAIKEEKKVKKSLKYSIFDGSFYGVMESFTSSFIIPYSLFLHASNLIIALISSIPDLFSSIFQLSAIKVRESVKSKKTIIVAAAFIQSVLWIPLIFIPYFFSQRYEAVFLLIFITMIAMIGTFINPLWMSLMGDLVPEDERGRYFSKRNAIIGIVHFSATFVAGFLLQFFSKKHPLIGFGILFGVAFIARSISSLFIALMYEKESKTQAQKNPTSLRKFLKTITTDDYGKFVLFVCVFTIVVNISSPFTSVYLLRDLKISYLQFTILKSLELLSMMVFIKIWGSINDHEGSKRVLIMTGILIPFVPLSWLVSTNFYYLLLTQIFSGAVWGGFNLALGNFIFDSSTPEERTRNTAYFNLLKGSAIFFGAMIGGLLLNFFTIPVLLFISGSLRLTVALIALPKLREMRLVELNLGKSIFSHPIMIQPRQVGMQEMVPAHVQNHHIKKLTRKDIMESDRKYFKD